MTEVSRYLGRLPGETLAEMRSRAGVILNDPKSTKKELEWAGEVLGKA